MVRASLKRGIVLRIDRVKANRFARKLNGRIGSPGGQRGHTEAQLRENFIEGVGEGAVEGATGGIFMSSSANRSARAATLTRPLLRRLSRMRRSGNSRRKTAASTPAMARAKLTMPSQSSSAAQARTMSW